MTENKGNKKIERLQTGKSKLSYTWSKNENTEENNKTPLFFKSNENEEQEKNNEGENGIHYTFKDYTSDKKDNNELSAPVTNTTETFKPQQTTSISIPLDDYVGGGSVSGDNFFYGLKNKITVSPELKELLNKNPEIKDSFKGIINNGNFIAKNLASRLIEAGNINAYSTAEDYKNILDLTNDIVKEKEDELNEAIRSGDPDELEDLFKDYIRTHSKYRFKDYHIAFEKEDLEDNKIMRDSDYYNKLVSDRIATELYDKDTRSNNAGRRHIFDFEHMDDLNDKDAAEIASVVSLIASATNVPYLSQAGAIASPLFHKYANDDDVTWLDTGTDIGLNLLFSMPGLAEAKFPKTIEKIRKIFSTGKLGKIAMGKLAQFFVKNADLLGMKLPMGVMYYDLATELWDDLERKGLSKFIAELDANTIYKAASIAAARRNMRKIKKARKANSNEKLQETGATNKEGEEVKDLIHSDIAGNTSSAVIKGVTSKEKREYLKKIVNPIKNIREKFSVASETGTSNPFKLGSVNGNRYYINKNTIHKIDTETQEELLENFFLKKHGVKPEDIKPSEVTKVMKDEAKMKELFGEDYAVNVKEANSEKASKLIKKKDAIKLETDKRLKDKFGDNIPEENSKERKAIVNAVKKDFMKKKYADNKIVHYQHKKAEELGKESLRSKVVDHITAGKLSDNISDKELEKWVTDNIEDLVELKRKGLISEKLYKGGKERFKGDHKKALISAKKYIEKKKLVNSDDFDKELIKKINDKNVVHDVRRNVNFISAFDSKDPMGTNKGTQDDSFSNGNVIDAGYGVDNSINVDNYIYQGIDNNKLIFAPKSKADNKIAYSKLPFLKRNDGALFMNNKKLYYAKLNGKPTIINRIKVGNRYFTPAESVIDSKNGMFYIVDKKTNRVYYRDLTKSTMSNSKVFNVYDGPIDKFKKLLLNNKSSLISPTTVKVDFMNNNVKSFAAGTSLKDDDLFYTDPMTGKRIPITQGSAGDVVDNYNNVNSTEVDLDGDYDFFKGSDNKNYIENQDRSKDGMMFVQDPITKEWKWIKKPSFSGNDNTVNTPLNTTDTSVNNSSNKANSNDYWRTGLMSETANFINKYFGIKRDEQYKDEYLSQLKGLHYNPIYTQYKFKNPQAAGTYVPRDSYEAQSQNIAKFESKKANTNSILLNTLTNMAKNSKATEMDNNLSAKLAGDITKDKLRADTQNRQELTNYYNQKAANDKAKNINAYKDMSNKASQYRTEAKLNTDLNKNKVDFVGNSIRNLFTLLSNSDNASDKYDAYNEYNDDKTIGQLINYRNQLDKIKGDSRYSTLQTYLESKIKKIEDEYPQYK